ncbi:MAG TPA: glycosyltransferase family 4 protein [Candidatus Sulfotelmatobacter sp.]|nr:glycosyltransferase family 4 protein [Candidatus Sulfotelmatobacter sp.]
MRFLILTQYFPPEIGGAQTRLRSFAAELVHLGHEVEIVTAKPNYPKGAFFPGYEKGLYLREELDGCTVHRVWIYPAVGSGLKRLLNYISFTILCLYGLYRAQRPDYVFVESPPLFLSIAAVVARMFWRVPFIFNVADLWPDVIVDGGFMKEGWVISVLRKLERWSYRRAAYVNAVTDSILRILRDEKSVPAEKLLYLPNGADTRRFRPRPPDEDLKAKLGLSDKKIVLWAGTLGLAHGLDKVLAAAKLLQDVPEVHVLFVGDGSAREELLSLRDEWQIRNVSFHPPVSLDEIAAYYSIAFCGLASLIDIPLFEGARPSKIFPVLASGKPLIFAGKGETAELVEAANAGIVVPPGDERLLADAILKLLHSPERCEQLGKNGRRFVEEHLQWSRLVQDWLAQLELRSGRQQPATATLSQVSG